MSQNEHLFYVPGQAIPLFWICPLARASISRLGKRVDGYFQMTEIVCESRNPSLNSNPLEATRVHPRIASTHSITRYSIQLQSRRRGCAVRVGSPFLCFCFRLQSANGRIEVPAMRILNGKDYPSASNRVAALVLVSCAREHPSLRKPRPKP